MHASGFPLKWDGHFPALYVLTNNYPKEYAESPQKAYERYLQLPFFAFAAAARSGQLKKGMKFGQETEEIKPAQTTKKARGDARKLEQKRLEELEAENSRALDEAFAESEAARKKKQKEEETQDLIGKALAYNFRTADSPSLLHNPHFLLPSRPQAASGLELSRCIEQRELLMMRTLHETIDLLRALPEGSMNVPKIQEVIKEGKMHLDPASGGMDLFFQLPSLTPCFTLSLAKLLHIVRVPQCASLSLRQMLHPQVFKSGYASPNFPHILYNQIAQNFYRSMSLRHCTMAMNSADILQAFGDFKEFHVLKSSLSHLEWYCAEVEFPIHRGFFCAPPEGFLSGVYGSSDPLYAEFLQHFILQINISDRIRIPMTPFENKRGKAKYEPFARSLVQKLEAWRPKFKELSECLPVPPSIMSTDTPVPSAESVSGEGKSTVTLGSKTEVGAGTRMLRELLKILFMCCLGAQTEVSGNCAYSELSEYTLLFLLHPKLSKVWDDRFLIAQPLSYPCPGPEKILTLENVWGTLFKLPEDFSQGKTWLTFRKCYLIAVQIVSVAELSFTTFFFSHTITSLFTTSRIKFASQKEFKIWDLCDKMK